MTFHTNVMICMCYFDSSLISYLRYVYSTDVGRIININNIGGRHIIVIFEGLARGMMYKF